MKIDFKSVVVCLINTKNRTIVLQHRDEKKNIVYPGLWGLPAGSVEKGEKVTDAAKRECLEETGYIARDLSLFFVQIYKRYDAKLIKRHCFVVIYDEVQKIVCREGREMKFLSFDALEKLPMIPMHKEIAKNALDVIL